MKGNLSRYGQSVWRKLHELTLVGRKITGSKLKLNINDIYSNRTLHTLADSKLILKSPLNIIISLVKLALILFLEHLIIYAKILAYLQQVAYKHIHIYTFYHEQQPIQI